MFSLKLEKRVVVESAFSIIALKLEDLNNASCYYVLFICLFVCLQGMGVSSNEDRTVYKKEVKNLKPFADKQKKLIEKQRKEEKKIAKQKKKK